MTHGQLPLTLAHLEPGNHLCFLFETDEEHRAILVPFIRQGLEQAEKVLYIVDNGTVEAVVGYLRDDGLDVKSFLARRQLVFLSKAEAFLRDGIFAPDRIIALLQKETDRAREEGYGTLRVTSEMTWELQGLPGTERLIEYKAMLDDFLSESQCLVLCQYDRRRFEAAALLDVLRTHPIAVVGTKLYNNLYFVPPQELLGPDLPAAKLAQWINNLAEHQQVDDALWKRTRDLEDREKELNYLFAISDLVEEVGISLEEIFQGVVDLIPPAWQYPEVACARVLLEGRAFETTNFRATDWKQASNVVVQGDRIGTIEVHYLEERPESGEGPFLKEEKDLLDAIAQRLGRIIERKRAEKALQESEERYHSLFDRLPLGFYRTTQEWQIVDANPALVQMLGYRNREAVLEMSAWDLFVDANERKQWQVLMERDGAVSDFEMRLHRHDGTIIWVRDNGRAVRHETGRVLYYESNLENITERVLAKQMLEQRIEQRTREIERRRSVAEGLRDILAVLNSNRSLDEVLDFILEQASRLLGAEAVAIYRLQGGGDLLTIQASHGLESEYVADANIPIGQSVTGRAVLERQPVTLPDIAAFSSDDDLMVDRRRQALLERLVSEYRALLAVPLKNAETYGAITLYYHSPRQFTDEEIGLAVAFGDQVALAIQNAQLRDQVKESAVAAERSRLARELHDSVTQILFSVSLTAEVLPTVWERDPYEGQQALDEMRELTRGALAEMRTLLMELRPAALLKAKIDDLLRQLAEGIIGRARVPVKVSIEGLRPLSPEIKIALFRIAQEALNNVAKHSEASHATVNLRCYPPVSPRDLTGSAREGDIEEAQVGSVELAVNDNGRGFDMDRVSPDHMGLGIMRERAEAIDATLAVESQLGHGTRVIVTWQNKQQKEQDDGIETDKSDNR